ncbi:MAG: SLC13 family permease [Chromatiales bacterium]|nr:SLC13 family permease [Chromatiales bacterium]
MVTELGWEAWVTLSIVILMLVALIKEVARPHLILLGCLGLLLLFGILSPEEAFLGLSNKAVVAIGALFVVATGVQNTGALQFTEKLLFPRSSNLPAVTTRLMLTTASLSAFLNNTPIVAMLIPQIRAWCDKSGVPASKLMIPLSFGAILGGMCTLIGTSTNLLVVGVMEAAGYSGLGLFDLAWIGVPAALAATAYFALVGHRLLPDHDQTGQWFDEGLRDCIFELRVADDSPFIGQALEQAGLRDLKDAYLAHLRRNKELLPVSPGTHLHAGDVLTFIGSISVLERLLEQPGLSRVRQCPVDDDQSWMPLYEAVVSASSNLVGKSLKEVCFRERYQGVVLGIYRRATTIDEPLGRVPIKAGDLLLVEADSEFDRRWNQDRDEFYLVAPRQPRTPRFQTAKAPLALAILLGVVMLAAFEVADIVTTAFIGALAMIVTGCLRGRDARRAVDVPILIVIAAALGLGQAIESTGLAAVAAHWVTQQAELVGPIGVVAMLYLATSLLTELITNNAAAALMVGVGLAAAQELGLPPEAFAVTVAIAASASFLTPIGYQTNLMVMGAGGYRYTDYTRAGFGVYLIVAVTALLMIKLIWL